MITLRVRQSSCSIVHKLISAELSSHDHSIIACSRHIYNGVILHAHPVRGESHNQRNTTGEVATEAVFVFLLHKLVFIVSRVD